MGGVDLSDNLLCHFTTERNRMKKFYKKMLRHLLDMAVLNSFITYKNLGGKMKRIDFIIKLSENIISKYSRSLPVPSTCGGRHARLTAKLHRLLSRHFPKYCPLTKKTRKNNQKLCRMPQNNARKGTSYWCEDCGVALCVVPCFEDWHTKQ